MELYIADNLKSFLDGGLRGTLAEMGQNAWKSSLPSLVVSPSPTINNALRHDLSAHGIGMLGVEFGRPEDLRSIISGRVRASFPESDLQNLSAIMREVAFRLSKEDPQNQTFASMAVAPDFLLDTVMLLASGGWSPASIPSDDLRTVGERFIDLTRDFGMELATSHDLSVQGGYFGKATPVFHQIALVGFDASHWDLWGLLSTAAMASERASVWLPDWSVKAEEAEMVWFSSWEHLRGRELFPLEGVKGPAPMENLALAYEAGIEDADDRTLNSPLEFRVEEDYGQLAKAIVGEALCKVDQGVERLCVAVPAGSFIGRNVSKLLCDLEVEHFFVEGNSKTGIGESGAWNALLRYLDTEEVTFLKEFFQALPTVPKAMREAKVTTSRLVRVLENYRDTILTDQTDAILSKLDGKERKAEVALRNFIESLSPLPLKETLEGYCDGLISICEFLGWNERASMIDERRKACHFSEGSFHRTVFIRWIGEMPGQRDRSEMAGKAYAPIQIVPVDGAHLLEWDHIIMAGANEGVFPKTPDYPAYISVNDIKDLNRRVKELNAAAVTDSEDDTHVIKGHALCIPPIQSRMLQGRNFSRLIRNTDSMTICAVTHDETDGGCEMFPSDVFTICYALKFGEAISQTVFQRMAGSQAHYDYPRVSTFEHSRIEEFKNAHGVRKLDKSGFSEYEFSLMNPNHGVTVPASSWSYIATAPEIVFLRYFLGVDLSPEGDDFQWERAVGVWAHRILAQSIGTGAVELPENDEWVPMVRKSGEQLRKDFELLAEASCGPAPGWLDHLVSQSVSVATSIASALGSASLRDMGYTHVFSEYSIDSDYKLPDGTVIKCFGYIDLLLTDNPDTFNGAKVAVLDAKTGADKPLSVKGIDEGKGIQVVSYGLALEAKGAADVQMGLVTINNEFGLQVGLNELTDKLGDMDGLGGVLRRIAYGDFGHNGTTRSGFDFSNRLPLATLPLEAKREPEFVSHQS